MRFYPPTSTSSSSLPACPPDVKKALENECDKRKGCKGKPRWEDHKHTRDQSTNGGRPEDGLKCDELRVICKGESSPAGYVFTILTWVYLTSITLTLMCTFGVTVG